MSIQNPVVRGLGFYVPERVLTNADLERIVDTTDEWIITRTGIRERHVAAPGEATSDLCLQAARSALADADMDADELTHIVVATLTPDSYVPSTACILEDKLGVKAKTAFDINAACSGFTYALDQARSIIALRPDSRVLIVGSEVLTTRTNWQDRSTCVLFGDGAGAAILTGRDQAPGGGEVLDTILGSDGSLAELLTVKGGGSGTPYERGQEVGDEYFIHMEGREVFKHAVRHMENVAVEIVQRNGFEGEAVDLMVPHQANYRIISAVAKKLGLPEERIYMNIERYGNTSAASVPIALAEARHSGAIRNGDLVLIVSFGGGFTWGAALVRF